MANDVFLSLFRSGFAAESEPGYDCGACYDEAEITCRPILVPTGKTYGGNAVTLAVYSCGRIEVIGGPDNLCLAAADLIPARMYNH